jgi:cytochrome c5
MSDEHESPIKTPKQLIAVVLFAFLVPITAIVLLVNYVNNSTPKVGEGSEAMTPAATAQRIAPVGHLDVVATASAVAAPSGEETFKGVCSTCHGEGIAGAPKFGDTKAWSARLAQGASTLFEHAIKGFQGKAGVMPAKGGRPDLADIDVERAVVYMANGSGAKLTDPPAPAGSAAPAAATAGAQPAGPIAPVAAATTIAAVAAANASAAASASGAATDPGQKLFQGLCISCHGSGVGGAPKFGNKADWAPRIAKGQATLYQHALNGFNGMPARGGSTESDDTVKAAVNYMINAAK